MTFNARWLPLFLAVTLQYPSALAQTSFVDATSGANLGSSPGGGAIVLFDCNNDGLLDVAMNSYSYSSTNALLRENQGGNTFADRDSQLSLQGRGMGAGDFDNDGDVDLLGRNILNVNQGGSSCSFAPSSPAIPDNNMEASMFADIDGNGLLDVWYPGASYMWLRNLSGAAFSSSNALPGLGSTVANGEGGTVADFTNDGIADLLWADSTTSSQAFTHSGNFTYTNIESVSSTFGLPENVDEHEYMEWAWGDCDNDGDLDLVVSGADSEGLYINDGSGSFTEETGARGLSFSSPDGAAWGDIDNDGDLDLVIVDTVLAAKVYQNNGSCSFVDIAAAAGLTSGNSAGMTVGLFDSDNDGDLDIVTNNPIRLLRNETNNGNYLRVYSKGLGAGYSPRTPLNAQIEVYPAGTTTVVGHREIFPSYNKLQLPMRQHFGLDAAQQYDISVDFPSGTKITVQNCRPDQLSLQIGANTLSNTLLITELPNSTVHDCNAAAPNVSIDSPAASSQVNGIELITFTVDHAYQPECSVDNSIWTPCISGETRLFQVLGWDAVADGADFTLYVRDASPRGGSDSDSVYPLVRNDALVPFVDVSTAANLGSGYGGSLVFPDCNNDGFLDVAMNSWDESLTAGALRENQGDNTFVDRDSQSTYTGRGMSVGDVNNDGYDDMISRNTLVINAGTGACSYSEISPPLYNNNSEATMFADIDGNGWLDVYFPGASYIWSRNNGDDTFSSVSYLPGVGTGTSNGEGATAADFNNDGYVDFLYADSTSSSQAFVSAGSYTYTNHENVAGDFNLPENVSDHENMEWAWADCDNDGDLDLLISGAEGEGLYINDGSGSFTEGSVSRAVVYGDSEGAAWGDIDNDGDQDLAVVDSGAGLRIFSNNGSCFFSEIGTELGLGPSNSTGERVGFFDSDNDGDLDVLVGMPARLLINNNYANPTDSLKVYARGQGAGFAPRTPIGAQIDVYEAGTSTLVGHREIFASYNQLQPPLRQHFGLSGSAAFDVVVRFPSGTTVTVEGCQPDQLSLQIASNTLPNTMEVWETTVDVTHGCRSGTWPVMAITSPVDGGRGGSSLPIVFSETDLPNAECSLDNTNWVSCTSGTTTLSELTGWGSIAEGAAFSVYLRDTDVGLALASVSIVNVTKDETAPVVAFTAPAEGAMVLGSEIIAFTNSEATNPHCSINSNAWAACTSGSQALSSLPGWASLTPGQSVSLNLRDVDEAGNEGSAVRSLTFGDANDIDNDGVPNAQDQCPGAADVHSDSDGVADCNDGCPIDSAKTAPGACGCGIVDIDADRDGIADCVDTDDDNDGIDDETEAELGTSPTVADSDGDGSSDGVEVADGSDPLDQGSVLPVLETTICTEWNSYLSASMTVMEHTSRAETPLEVDASLANYFGNSQSDLSFAIGSNQQIDVLLSAFGPAVEDSYGTVCSMHNGIPGELVARAIHYRPLEYIDSFMVVPVSLQRAVKGIQNVVFNTYPPGWSYNEPEKVATNWVHVISRSDVEEGGVIRVFDLNGDILVGKSILLRPGARLDVSAHEFGPSQAGLVQWIPNNPQALFQLRGARYCYEQQDGRIGSLLYGTHLDGLVGSGRLLAAPVDTRGGLSILEVSNSLAVRLDADVAIYNAAGELVGSQTIGLKPYSSTHLLLNSILDEQLGSIRLQGDRPNSLVGVVMKYGTDEDGSVRYMYSETLREALGRTFISSFNTYLGQTCSLDLLNVADEAVRVGVELRNPGGTLIYSASLENDDALQMSGLSAVSLDLCSMVDADQYGSVIVELERAGTVVGSVIRKGQNNKHQFAVPLIP